MAAKRKAEALDALPAAEPSRATRRRAREPEVGIYPLPTVAEVAARIRAADCPLLPPLVAIVTAYADPRFLCLLDFAAPGVEAGTLIVHTGPEQMLVEARYHVHVVGRRPGAGPLGGDVVDVRIAGLAMLPYEAQGASHVLPTWAQQPCHGDQHDHRWTNAYGGAFELLGGHYWKSATDPPARSTLARRHSFPAHFPVDLLSAVDHSRRADGAPLFRCHWDFRYQLHL